MKPKPKKLYQWAATLCAAFIAVTAHAADKKPNIVMLMQDDTGWFDFGHPRSAEYARRAKANSYQY